MELQQLPINVTYDRAELTGKYVHSPHEWTISMVDVLTIMEYPSIHVDA
jgi:hypothetical protein